MVGGMEAAVVCGLAGWFAASGGAEVAEAAEAQPTITGRINSRSTRFDYACFMTVLSRERD